MEQHDPPAEVSAELGALGMVKDEPECHAYGQGNNAFVGRVEGRAVRVILSAAGFIRDAHQYRGHTNYTHSSGQQMAQTRMDAAGQLHVSFLALASN